MPNLNEVRIYHASKLARLLLRPARTADCLILLERQDSMILLSSPIFKNISVSALPKSYLRASSFHPGTRGASRSSRTLGWGAVDAAASGVQRDGRAGFGPR